MKKILLSTLFWRECKQYGVSIWACPSFVFLLIGFVTIVAIISTYMMGQVYASPQYVAPIVLAVAFMVFVPGAIVANTFEKLAEANKMKSEFVSIASHQLRSPLSSIRWSLEVLENGRAGELNPKQKEYLKAIADNNKRMTKLVSDLLNVSRIEEGKFFLRRESIALDVMAKSIVETLKPFAEKKHITVSVEAERNIPNVQGDETYLEVVIANLVENAIQYSKENGTISIRLFPIDSIVRFEVKDSGLGIPRNEQKYLFQKFFRAENAVRHQTKGTGLGLFIASAVVKQSGGRMGFRSQEGKGSTFWFELPARH